MIDRQTVMMVTNLVVGALGGLALVFVFHDITTLADVARGMVPGAVIFAVVSLVLQMTRPMRALGVLVAYMFFTTGLVTAYILVQEMYPSLLPVQFTNESAQYVVRALIALIGVLSAVAWAKANPYTPIPPITLTFKR